MSHNYDDLSPQAFEFSWKGREYVLREPSEAAVLLFRQAQLKGGSMVEGKTTVSIERIYESQSILVASCTFEKLKDGAESQAKAEVVKSFPARVVKDLFQRAKKMGELDEDDTEEGIAKQIEALEKRLAAKRSVAPKNEQPAGTGTSS